MKTHGMSRSGEYKSWVGMKNRCFNPKSTGYKYWGGKGITVCDRWMNSFENFLDDMGLRPEGSSLDRINSNGNYSKDNCRWATRNQQIENRDYTRILNFKGKKLAIKEWAMQTGVGVSAINSRLQRGESVEDALSSPKNKHIRYLTFKGRTLKILEWAKIYGIQSPTLRKRLDFYNLTIEDALTKPVKRRTPKFRGVA